MQGLFWGFVKMAEKRVKLKSSDDEMFEVDEAVAFESQAVKNMIEDTGIDAPIPLPNVSSKILAKVIEYCKYHVENQKTSEDKPATPEDEIKAWDADFVKVDQATLFDLILVSGVGGGAMRVGGCGRWRVGTVWVVGWAGHCAVGSAHNVWCWGGGGRECLRWNWWRDAWIWVRCGVGAGRGVGDA